MHWFVDFAGLALSPCEGSMAWKRILDPHLEQVHLLRVLPYCCCSLYVFLPPILVKCKEQGDVPQSDQESWVMGYCNMGQSGSQHLMEIKDRKHNGRFRKTGCEGPA